MNDELDKTTQDVIDRVLKANPRIRYGRIKVKYPEFPGYAAVFYGFEVKDISLFRVPRGMLLNKDNKLCCNVDNQTVEIPVIENNFNNK